MAGILPIISIVTPSFNQGHFLEETICPILQSRYAHVEYVIVDGGSNDGSIDVIRQYQDRLAYWVSEPDDGQYAAINKGFAHTTGEVMAWLNADDKYTPWALEVVGEIFANNPQVEWLTSAYPLILDEKGRAVFCSRRHCSSQGFLQGRHLPHPLWGGSAFIQQESTFWRRSLWERTGGFVDSSLRYAGDFELWSRFAQYAEIFSVETPLGAFRRHKEQKTHKAYEEYLREADQVLRNLGSKPPWRWMARFRSILNRVDTWVRRVGLLGPAKLIRHT